MININTAKTPRGLLNSFFSFVFFRLHFFLTHVYNTTPLVERRDSFHWNYYKSIVKHYYFIWSNIVSSKNKKEEITYIVNHYLNISLKFYPHFYKGVV